MGALSLRMVATRGCMSLLDASNSFAEPPTEINDAFWQACHGGQRRTAELLLARGARLDWVPFHNKQTPLEIAGSIDTGREALIGWLREQATKVVSEHP